MEASGTWLPAGDIEAASAACIARILYNRRDGQRKEAVRIARRRWYRPWQIKYKSAMWWVEWNGYAWGWYVGQEQRARLLLTQAQAIPRAQPMFISTKDFNAIHKWYQPSPPATVA